MIPAEHQVWFFGGLLIGAGIATAVIVAILGAAGIL